MTAGLRTGAHCGLRTCAADALRLGLQPRMPVVASTVARVAIGSTYVLSLRLSRCGASDGFRAFWLCPLFVLDDIHAVLCKCFEGGTLNLSAKVALNHKSMSQKLQGKLNPLLITMVHQWLGVFDACLLLATTRQSAPSSCVLTDALLPRKSSSRQRCKACSNKSQRVFFDASSSDVGWEVRNAPKRCGPVGAADQVVKPSKCKGLSTGNQC